MTWIYWGLSFLPFIITSRMQKTIALKYQWETPNEPFWSSVLIMELVVGVLVAFRHFFTIIPAIVVGIITLIMIERRLVKHNPPSSYLFLERINMIYAGFAIILFFTIVLPSSNDN